jgi:hypothetical protein
MVLCKVLIQLCLRVLWRFRIGRRVGCNVALLWIG